MALVINTYLCILIFLPIAALATWRISVFFVIEEGPFGVMVWLREMLGVRHERRERKGVPVEMVKHFQEYFDKTLNSKVMFEDKFTELIVVFSHLNEITEIVPVSNNPLGKLFSCVWCMSFWVSIFCAWPIALLGLSITPAMGLLVAFATSALAIGYDKLLRRS